MRKAQKDVLLYLAVTLVLKSPVAWAHPTAGDSTPTVDQVLDIRNLEDGDRMVPPQQFPTKCRQRM